MTVAASGIPPSVLRMWGSKMQSTFTEDPEANQELGSYVNGALRLA